MTSNPNPVEPEPTEIFFTKDVVSALSNVEPVVEGEQGDSEKPQPQEEVGGKQVDKISEVA